MPLCVNDEDRQDQDDEAELRESNTGEHESSLSESRWPSIWAGRPLDARSSPAQELYEDEGDRDDEEEMDERTQHISADDADSPKNQENDGQGIEHTSSSPGQETERLSRQALFR